MTGLRLDVARVESLLDRQQNLDAWKLFSAEWASRSLEDLDEEQLIQWIRLSHRLGSETLCQWARRFARRKHGTHPGLRYYAETDIAPGMPLWLRLKTLVEKEPLNSASPDWNASWHAHIARFYFAFNDDESAYRELRKARTLTPQSYWLDAFEAHMLFERNRIDEARVKVESSWQLQPGNRLAGLVYGRVIAHQQGPWRAARFQLDWIRNGGQSFDMLQQGLYWAVDAIHRQPDRMTEKNTRILWEFTQRCERLVPLADRRCRAAIMDLRLTVANRLRLRSEFNELVKASPSAFYQAVARNIRENQGARRTVLPHRRIRQDSKTCVPASAATCLSALGLEVDQRELSHLMTHDGTAIWRLKDWCSQQGLVTRSFSFTAKAACDLIDRGIPFMLCLRGFAWAHATAVVGVDRERGVVLVQDPSSDSFAEGLLEGMESAEAPLGFECFAMVPESKAEILDQVPLRNVAYWDGYHEWIRRLEGGLACEPFPNVELLDEDLQDFAQATLDLKRNRFSHAWPKITQLTVKFPHCHSIQHLFMGAIELAPDKQVLMDALRHLLDLKPIPILDAKETYIFPDPQLFARYATLCQLDISGRETSRRMLDRGLTFYPSDPAIISSLGDWYWDGRDKETAIFLYRMASCLDPENEWYARSYAFRAAEGGRFDEGFEFLRERALKLTGEVGGGFPQRTLVEYCLDLGHPDRGLQALDSALTERPNDSRFAAFACLVLLHHGQRVKARHVARRLEQSQESAERLALIDYDLALGRVDNAWEKLERDRALFDGQGEWLERTFELIGVVRGTGAQKAWLDERREQCSLDPLWWRLYVGWQVIADEPDDRRRMLTEYTERFPFDRWGWRERAWNLSEAIDRDPSQTDVIRQFHQLVKETESRGGYDPSLLGLRARSCELMNQPKQALKLLIEALHLDSTYLYALAQIFTLVDRHFPQRRDEIVDTLSRALLDHPGNCFRASDYAVQFANRVGYQRALKRVESWRRERPDDAYILYAWVELKLRKAQGRRDWEEVLPQLAEAIRRYPQHKMFHEQYAQACAQLGRDEDARKAYRRLVVLHPSDAAARLELARLEWQSGRASRALKILRLTIRKAPAHIGAFRLYAQYLAEMDRHDEALSALREILERHDYDMGLWEHLIAQQRQMGAGALDTARELASRYPHGAYAQMVLAQEMGRSLEATSFNAVIDQFDRAVNLNRSSFEVAWEYALFLARNQAFDEAMRILERHEPYSDNVLGVVGAKAHLTWTKGDQNAAFDILVQAVQDHPDYPWGWKRLMDWAEELNKTAEIVDLVRKMPDVDLQDRELQVRRFQLLGRHASQLAEVRAAWSEVRDRFGTDSDLWFDLAHILLDRGARTDALAHASQWKGPRDLDFCVHAIDFYARLEHASCDRLLIELALMQDSKASLAMDYVMGRWGGQAWVKTALASPLYQAWFKGKTMDSYVVQSVFANAAQQGWSDVLQRWCHRLLKETPSVPTDFALQRCLVELACLGHPMTTLNARLRHPDRFQQSVTLWMAVGYALVQARKSEEAIQWLEDWEQREGVEPWIITNLIGVYLNLGRANEAVLTCRRVLERAPLERRFQDTDSLSIVRMQLLKGLLIQDDPQAFMDEWRLHCHHLDQASPDVQWFKGLCDLYAASEAERLGLWRKWLYVCHELDGLSLLQRNVIERVGDGYRLPLDRIDKQRLLGESELWSDSPVWRIALVVLILILIRALSN